MDLPECMTTEEIRLATLDNEHLGMLSEYILHGWLSTKSEVQKDLHHTGHYKEIGIIDGIVMKGRRIIVPASPQNKALNQMQLNHMGR